MDKVLIALKNDALHKFFASKYETKETSISKEF